MLTTPKIVIITIALGLVVMFALPPLVWVFGKWDCLFFPTDCHSTR